MFKRVVLICSAAMLVAGCAVAATSSDALPSAPAAGDFANRQVVAQGVGSITLRPASPHGAAVGTAYAYSMPMCGTAGPIDIDGSFWDAGPGPGLDSRAGTFRLLAPDAARFISADGQSIDLTRHGGPKAFPICS